MKKLFDKENFHFSGFDSVQRRQSLIVIGVLALMFVVSSFTFVNALYSLVDNIGSIISGSPDVAVFNFFRSMPLYLSFFMAFWGLLLLHAFFRNDSEERRLKSMKKDAAALLVFSLLTFFYISISRFAGLYSSFVEGSPSPAYPLDAMLFSLPFIALSTVTLLDGKRILDAFPYRVPSRGPVVQKARFAYCFFLAVWTLFALYSFSGFFMGLFIIDFVHGYLPYSIALLLVFFTNFVFLAFWEFYYNNVKAEKRKDVLLPLALVALVVSIAVAVFYFVALGANLDGPANVGFGVLPIAFSASVNIAMLLTVATPIIVSIVALIKGILLRKKD